MRKLFIGMVLSLGVYFNSGIAQEMTKIYCDKKYAKIVESVMGSMLLCSHEELGDSYINLDQIDGIEIRGSRVYIYAGNINYIIVRFRKVKDGNEFVRQLFLVKQEENSSN